MKTPLIITLFASLSIIDSTQAEDSPISVSIAIPAERGSVRSIYYRDKTTHFHVIVSNTSDKPQRIWREQFSWGYYGLSFEFTDEHGKKSTANKKKVLSWNHNFPDWWILETLESIVLNLYFADPKFW
jgi:hypothetical protein